MLVVPLVIIVHQDRLRLFLVRVATSVVALIVYRLYAAQVIIVLLVLVVKLDVAVVTIVLQDVVQP